MCCQPSGFCQVTLGGDALNLSVPQRFLPYLTSTEAPGFTPCGHAEWTGDSGSRASEPLCGRDHVTPGRQQDFTAAGACFVQEGEGRGSLKSLEEITTVSGQGGTACAYVWSCTQTRVLV